MSTPVPDSRPASAPPDAFLRRELPVLILLALLAAGVQLAVFWSVIAILAVASHGLWRWPPW